LSRCRILCSNLCLGGWPPIRHTTSLDSCRHPHRRAQRVSALAITPG
jgi:hypothetical protein